MPLRPLFVTQLYEASLAGERGFGAFNTELEQACRMLAREDRAGRAWCKDNGIRALILHASPAGRPLYESLGFKSTNEMRIEIR